MANFQKTPAGLQCETTVPSLKIGKKLPCRRPASYVYGPECESQSGKLMYLCDEHAQQIKDWRLQHLNDPVECLTHGNIGKVKDYLILTEMKN